VLLDEPTNHLDIESILWLERFLAGARFATVTVTHDRLFLQRAANRILELDRRNAGGLLDVAGDYGDLRRAQGRGMSAQERREDVLRNTLRRETEWLRRGPKARSTKQEARIQRAGALADEVGELATRNRAAPWRWDFQGSGRKTKRLIEARGVSCATARAPSSRASTSSWARARASACSPDGCGKSTLLRVLTGAQAPTAGESRAPTASRSPSSSRIGPPSIRRAPWPTPSVPTATSCSSAARASTATATSSASSSGRSRCRSPWDASRAAKQSRLLVAQLMLRPASVLVLDEPTTTSICHTLGVLEEALTELRGRRASS